MNEFFDLLAWMVINPIESIFLLLVEYMALASMYHQPKWKWLSRIAVVPFVIQDAVVNIFGMTLIMSDLPKEWLVTARLKRYKKLYSTSTYNFIERWRYWFARTACRLMNKYDPGHC